MNWRPILSLSVTGALMGLASVIGYTKGIEPLLWLVIYVFCAVWISMRVVERKVLHGILTGLICGGIAPLIQAVLFTQYVKNRPDVLAEFNRPGVPIAPRTFFFALVVPIAIASGVALGLLTFVASYVVNRPVKEKPGASLRLDD